ncbi:MAG TPA: ribosome biogenesis GTPase Der [Chthoniobacteraceae bacterium]|jgi:GTP-binding protein|nr:ribosome biogenesis GTPase Der [Chthoniobacteraceae bacterium]
MSRIAAIVGRPNVGKSALFNRLVGRKISIVHDMPGVTRDRISAKCKLGRKPFTVFDTGGIGADVDHDFTAQVHTEVEIAVETASLIVFVVDGQEGLAPVDRDLAKRLRRVDRPMILVVNKIDHPNHRSLVSEFSRLGFEPVLAVSAEHGIGIGDLVDRIDAMLPQESDEERAEEKWIPTKVAIVGRPNVGKSSITNALLKDERTLVSPISGTTRDAVDIPYQRGDQHFILIDTAGIRPRGKVDNSVEVFSVMRSEGSINRADLCILVIDAALGVTAQDKKIAGLIQEAGKPCIVAVNKWDLIEDQTEDKDALNAKLEEFREALFFLSYAPLVLLSAKTGQSMDRLFRRVENVREASKKRLGTGPLNRVISAAFQQQPPALRSGRRFKVLYATQADPPRDAVIPVVEIVIFCNSKELLDPSCKRFLENRIRAAQQWEGLPIFFRFRQREVRGKTNASKVPRSRSQPTGSPVRRSTPNRPRAGVTGTGKPKGPGTRRAKLSRKK